MQNIDSSTESQISQIQNLSFGSFHSACIRRNYHVGSPTGILTNDYERKTVLSLILSDQCPWSTVINGRTDMMLSGSVIDQIDHSWKLISNILEREERIDRYPLLAFSEAYLNAICHRDYSNPEPITIDISNESLRICSPGGYFRFGNNHDQRCRNPRLTSILCHMGYKNSKIHGMAGFQTMYRKCLYTPYILFSENYTETVLPAMIKVGLYEGMRNSITRLIAERFTLTETDLSSLLAARPATVAGVVKRMREEKILTESNTLRRRELSLTDRDHWVQKIRESGFYPQSNSLNTLSEYPNISSTGIPAMSAAWAYMI